MRKKPELIRKGSSHWSKIHPELAKRGEKHKDAILTEEQVIEIRMTYADGKASQRNLAKRYGVSRGAITGILSRKSWSHVA